MLYICSDKSSDIVKSVPFVSSRVIIFGTLQLQEANVGVKMRVSWSLHQFLHESVNCMINLCGLQYGIRAGFSSHDLSVFEVRMVLSHLARRLVELFLNVDI